MITNVHKTDYGVEGNVRWELFDREISFAMDNGADIAYAEKCAEALNSLSGETVNDIWKAAKKYCLFFMDLAGTDGGDFERMGIKVTEDTPAEELRSEIFPSVFIVNKPKDGRIGFHLECGCSWEPEHGLEITILDGRLVYLGAFESRSAWEEFDPDDEWNFVNDVEE